MRTLQYLTIVINTIFLFFIDISSASAADKSVITKYYRDITEASNSGDLDKYLSVYDQFVSVDTVYIDQNGNLRTVAETRSNIKAFFSISRNISVKRTTKDLGSEDTKVVIQDNTVSEFEMSQKNSWLPMIANSVSEDTWILKGDKWKLSSSKTIKMEVKNVKILIYNDCINNCTKIRIICNMKPSQESFVHPNCDDELQSCTARCNQYLPRYDPKY